MISTSNPKDNISVHAGEIAVGRPLPWAIYDENGMLLLNQGMAPASQAQIDAMLERGLYRRAGAGSHPKPARPSIPPMGLGPREGETIKPAGDPIPFDELAMQPGDMLQLHSALEVVSDDMLAGLIGYLKDRAIVISTPVVSGKYVLVKEGTIFNIKTFTGTSLYTFRTRVLASYIQPMPHLHLEYPKLVYETKVRKALRAIVNVPGTLHDPLSDKNIDVQVKDLSVGGAKVVLPERIACETNSRFVLSFKVKIGEDVEESVVADSTMRCLESRLEKDTQVHTMGLQFKALSRPAVLAVMALVYRRQLHKV